MCCSCCRGHALYMFLDVAKAIPRGRITFLGTGAALPSKYRNVTSHVVEFFATENEDVVKKSSSENEDVVKKSPSSSSLSSCMLLDCGEGTYGQLFRYVHGNKERFKSLLASLYLVWISHNHADHHLGLVRILSERDRTVTTMATTTTVETRKKCIYIYIHDRVMGQPWFCFLHVDISIHECLCIYIISTHRLFRSRQHI
jgi:hypothetical protein